MEIIDYTNIKGENQKALELIAQKAKKSGINIEPELVFDQVNTDADAKDIVSLCKLLKEDKSLSFEYISSPPRLTSNAPPLDGTRSTFIESYLPFSISATLAAFAS